MIIIFVVFILGFLCVGLGLKSKKKDDREAGLFYGIFILVVLMLVWGGLYTNSAFKIAQLRTFQNIDVINMEKAFERTLLQVDSESKSMLGIEKMEGYKIVSERMEAWTNQIRDYNKKLTGWNWYGSNLFFNWFVVSTGDLDYISIKK